jgi:hypothetical protein
MSEAVKNDMSADPAGASFNRPVAELARQACSPHFFRHSWWPILSRIPAMALAVHELGPPGSLRLRKSKVVL